jgi:hypothetical protein
LRASQFDKALDLAVKYDFLGAEKAYCLYRLKQDDEALKLLPVGPATQSAAQLHLAAQLVRRRTGSKGQDPQALTLFVLADTALPQGKLRPEHPAVRAAAVACPGGTRAACSMSPQSCV